jgi:hypothetical protein
MNSMEAKLMQLKPSTRRRVMRIAYYLAGPTRKPRQKRRRA